MKTDQANVARPMLCVEHSIRRHGENAQDRLRHCMLVSKGDCEVCIVADHPVSEQPVRYPSRVS